MELLFSVGTPMTSSQTSRLLEAGFTFILYQRGQLPLPFQQLQASATEVQLQNVEGRNGSKAVLREEVQKILPELAGCIKMDPRQRIALMTQERKRRLQINKLEKQRKLEIAAESKAFNSIQPAMEMLRRLLADATVRKPELTPSGHRKRIVSLALLLGPSVYSPKEIYYFDLPCNWASDDSNVNSKAEAEQFQTTVLRQFYKKIITSSDFMDFTEKPLGTQYVHICVVALGDLNNILMNEYYNNVLRLPGLPPSIHQALIRQPIGDSLETDPSSATPIHFSRKNRNKCFKIRIQDVTLEQSMDSVSCDGSSSSSFSSDILFNSNSFSCYQIPLRFKGVQCKNKRL
ncbi:hypothetical protein Ocin01_01092 [Orchesella cincta]|uniref:Uncharacterized protein n=1 Tax=Orchesella cincta TaxID=48709 RepID=A0A1D2NJY0_ORCCI|nr:hypothetical protein Ocin01_01092 [Orchesella cincta]